MREEEPELRTIYMNGSTPTASLPLEAKEFVGGWAAYRECKNGGYHFWLKRKGEAIPACDCEPKRLKSW